MLMLAVPHAVSLLATIGRLSARQLLLLAGLLAGVPLVFAPNDVVINRLQYAAQLALPLAALHYATTSPNHGREVTLV